MFTFSRQEENTETDQAVYIYKQYIQGLASRKKTNCTAEKRKLKVNKTIQMGDYF